MSHSLTKASKFLSYVLRHRPDEFGIVLDENGWVAIAELVEKSRGKIDEATLREVVRTNDKQRFALSDNGLKIRANQGHSVNIDLALKPSRPPELLFHGTAERFVDSIKTDGLISRSRQHVHLSLDRETARTVGARHGKPVIITVAAGRMHTNGIAFYLSDNGVWLTDHVAHDYLSFAD